MKKFFAFSAVAALVLASCSPKEEFAVNTKPVGDGFTVKATIVPETRTELIEDTDVYHVVWKAGDKIRCTGNGANPTTVIYVTSDDGTSTATFVKEDPEAPGLIADSLNFWAYYPATMTSKRLPSVQTYVPNGIAEPPMRGYYQRGEEDALDPVFEFRNICGALRLNLTTTQENVKVSSIVLQADNGLSGAYTNTNAAPAAVMTSTDATVTLKCPEVPLGTEPTAFFISVPEYEYAAFSITLYASDGRTQTRTLKEGSTLTVNCSEILPVDLSFDNLEAPSFGETATFAKGSDFNTAIKVLANPEISSYTDDDTTITKIVFLTESNLASGTHVEGADSESPIYVTYDEENTTITVSTPAKQFILPANSAYFFHRLHGLTQIEGWEDFETSNVESMYYFFGYNAFETLKVPDWDFSNLIRTSYMFYGAKCSSIDVSSMDFANDTAMQYMFSRAPYLSEVIFPDEVDCQVLESMGGLFRGCPSLEYIDMSAFINTENLQKISYAFAECPSLTKIDLDMDLSSATGVAYLFAGTFAAPEGKTIVEVNSPGTTYVDFTDFHISGLTRLGSTFRDSQFYTLELNWLDISEVTTLTYCFDRCNNLQSLDIEDWELHPDIVKGDMGYMFVHCPMLSELRLGAGFERPTDCTPTAFFGSTTNDIGGTHEGYLTGSGAGSLSIYCTQECADWLSQTNLRYLPQGHYQETVVPVYFWNISTGEEMSVTWKE